jgi:hypothetical protein
MAGKNAKIDIPELANFIFSLSIALVDAEAPNLSENSDVALEVVDLVLASGLSGSRNLLEARDEASSSTDKEI